MLRFRGDDEEGDVFQLWSKSSKTADVVELIEGQPSAASLTRDCRCEEVRASEGNA